MSLLHICTEAEWRSARTTGEHQPASLQSEGFIHCSTDQQVLATAAKWFQGQQGLWLLELDEGALGTDLVYEYPKGYTEAFPHLYAPLKWSAVNCLSRFECGEDGQFRLPTQWLSPDWDS